MIIPELEGKTINFDITPQQAVITHQIALKTDHERKKKWIASFENMAYPFVDIQGLQARLAFMVFSDDGETSCVHRLAKAQQGDLGISDKMLIDAIEESGGTLDMDGYYPINATNRYKLAEML